MKTIKNPFNLFFLIVTGLLLMAVPAYSMKEIAKTITKEAAVTLSTAITFTNKTGPLTVVTWDQNRAKVETNIIVDGRDEDVQQFLDFIETLNFTESSGNISFDNKFYTLFTETMLGGIRIVLLNGTVLRGISKINLSYTLTIPKSNSLNIISRYENVTLPDLFGSFTLDLYEGELQGKNLSGPSVITMKYAHAAWSRLQDVTLTLYESHLTMEQAGAVKLNSKYSTLVIAEAGNLDLDCYEDEITIGKHGNILVKAKYCGFILADFDAGTLAVYETTVEAGHINKLSVTAKYSTFRCRSVTEADFPDVYETTFSSGSVGKISAISKYSTFEIVRLGTSLVMKDSYEDNIIIDQVSGKFNQISVVSKYTDLEIGFEPGSLYKIDMDLTYTSLSYHPEDFRETRYHKDGDQFLFQGFIRGANEATCPAVTLKMYEGSVGLK